MRTERPDLPACARSASWSTTSSRRCTSRAWTGRRRASRSSSPGGLRTPALTCTVQVRRFDTLLDALGERQGDVVAAAIPITADLRRRFAVTSPYFKIPGPLRRPEGPHQPEPEPRRSRPHGRGGRRHGSRGLRQGVHDGATIRSFPELAAAQAALKAGEVDYLFADGLGACALDRRQGRGRLLRSRGRALSGEPLLRRGHRLRHCARRTKFCAVPSSYALQQLWDEGKYAELYLRFFPVSPF